MVMVSTAGYGGDQVHCDQGENGPVATGGHLEVAASVPAAGGVGEAVRRGHRGEPQRGVVLDEPRGVGGSAHERVDQGRVAARAAVPAVGLRVGERVGRGVAVVTR